MRKKERGEAADREADGGERMQRRRVSTRGFRGGRWSAATALLAAGLLIGSAGVTRAAPPAHSAEKGEALFQQKCAACHTIGKGKLVGPDLQGVGQRVSRDWMERFITAPSQVFAAQDPTALKLLKQFHIQMPDLGLSKAAVEALVVYLEGPTEAEHHAAAGESRAAAAPAPAGNPAVGEELFTGRLRLQNGGPECMACHTAAGVGALGGGSVGPDLTHVFRRYGRAGLASALKTIPFPTMQGVFQNRPLTPTEQADLLAFFDRESRKNPSAPASPWSFLWIGLGGFVVLTGTSQLLWSRRLKGVRKPLVGGRK